MSRFLFLPFVFFLSSCGYTVPEACFEDPEPVDSAEVYRTVFERTVSQRVDTFFVHNHQRGHFNGTALIAWKGVVLYETAMGYADLKSKEKLTLHHTFQLASVSKPLTALAVLQLYQKGDIALNDPVEKHLQDFPYRGITVEMLLTHRSGLNNYMYFCDNPDTLWPDKYKTMHNNDAFCIMQQILPPPYYAPNTRHDYNNTNYILLASIVEKVSKMSFEDYMNEYVFKAANMKTARIYNRENADKLIRPAKGYNGQGVEHDDLYLNGCVGDKGVYASIYDMFALDSTLRAGGIIPPNIQEEAYAPHNETKSNGQNYGYGWRLIENSNNGKIVFHTGWWKGFRTYFVRLVDKEQLIVILTNVKKGPFFQVEELSSLLDGLSIEQYLAVMEPEEVPH